MKRLIALAMSLLMVLALAACGGSAPASEAPAPDAPASDTPASDAPSDAAGARTLRVGMECVYAPYNWTQTDDSNNAVSIAGTSEYANGYDVQWAKRICDELGWTLEIVRSDWDGLIVGVQAGTIDCAIAGQSITAERLETVDFTSPYYYASIVSLVKKDGKYANAASVADLAGATCTSQMGTVWYNVCLPQISEANILAAQDTAPAMLVALDSGVCDLVVTDMPTAMAAVAVYPDFQLLDFSGTDGAFDVSEEEINIGISVQKGNTEVLEGINSVLAKYSEDDFNKFMDEAISIQPLSN